MGLSLFARIFRTPHTDEAPADLAPLERIARQHGYSWHKNAELFYHNQKAAIAFLLIDRHRGAYLFDIASWSAEMLRGAKAKSAPRRGEQRDVAVDEAHRVFMRKIDDVLNEPYCDVCNMLYLPNLTHDAYGELDESFRQLLPESRLIFADASDEEVLSKLAAALPLRETPLELARLESALFVQYTLLPDTLFDNCRQLTPQQKSYLHAVLPKRSLLCGGFGSGKSELLLLKALYEYLYDPDCRIAVVVPTQTACELMAARLLKIIEFAVIHIDPTAIRIVTPRQIAREHYVRVHGKVPLVDGDITPKMRSKRFDFADALFVDDLHCLDPRMLEYLEHLQSGRDLHGAAVPGYEMTDAELHLLTQGFRCPYSLDQALRSDTSLREHPALHPHRGNGLILALHLLHHLMETYPAETLLVIVPDAAFGSALCEEIAGFIGISPTLLEPHHSLLGQELDTLLVVPAEGTCGLQRRRAVIIDDALPEPLLRHAAGRASEGVDLIIHTEEDS